jgi:hypothetical protein
MLWCLALRQGYAIGDCTPIAVGSLERVMRAADERYHVLDAQEHPDGRLYGGRWRRGEDGRPLPYVIVPLAMLPADRRGAGA